MKVYFSGAASSGKTTLARYIAKTYNLPFLPECARMILSEQELQIDKLRSDIETVNQYEQDVFERQIKEEEKNENFVSDRTGLDVLAYASAYSTVLINLINSSTFQHCLTTLKDPNSYIFMIKPSKSCLKQDGVREHLIWDSLIALDAQLKLLFNLFEVRYYQIDTDNMAERIRLVNAILSSNSK